MKLQRLKINRLPGINVPLENVPEEANINVAIGTNGIGKSSLCRAVEALYWSDLGPTQRTSVNGEFELDGEAWWAENKNLVPPEIRETISLELDQFPDNYLVQEIKSLNSVIAQRINESEL